MDIARFLYLPSDSYSTSLGNVGLVAILRLSQILPDGRANVVIEMVPPLPPLLPLARFLGQFVRCSKKHPA